VIEQYALSQNAPSSIYFLINETNPPKDMDLNHLIKDCLDTYEYDSIPTVNSDSNVQMSFLVTELGEIAKPTGEEVSPVSPEDDDGQYNCKECDKVYPGHRQLSRHMQVHNDPDKYSCTVEGCEKTGHRLDAIRSHIRAHKRRIKKNEDFYEGLRNGIYY
jgi:hypothetical protein